MFKTPSEQFRVTEGIFRTKTGDKFGAFKVPSCEKGWQLRVICDDGATNGWEHVSVCAGKENQVRIPNWREMCQVKDICWEEDDVVMQLHPARRKYVNIHPNVLHLWRPVKEEIPTPPLSLV